ncbi:ABC transporter substrate-binding protein [Syntrophaceticus schinkii]|jgi:iron complex transport system substrate-binding protein|uniref:Periplasmic binding protein n=1 Tax=Syntrophaceticus schinkii TaxID=499207 RepID=A0A0B7MRF4_9FIRM|nr:ABC transporter substrate-binding protein [Syntrophaceticus schinkii]MDD2359724.1 ABC transporter substrate-binding protein [Syntrophaceticus schinkii]MDD4260632.1 ABC transporter substrate-binding protein [Syntrophaceticus schinkii]MDD4674803.1 ABC transporter substrate-binding protein [Syntrophaceticus schinkii]CEO90222.1 Periplasmic binding protein [Syntrophaceticus schinkii]
MLYRKRHTQITAILLLLIFVLLLSGCQQQNTAGSDMTTGEIVVTDDSGTQLKLDKYPERIISLTPNNTEILFALGLGERVVGVTTYCDYPEEVSQKARIGDLQGNVEEIVALKPDLVVAKAVLNEDIVSKLRKLDVPVLCVDPESIDGVYRSIELIAKVTGTDSNGDKIISEMKAKISDVQQKVAEIPEEERLKVFIEVGNDPLYTAGGDTYVDELVRLAGGINIASDITGYQMYSLETVVKCNPDAILAADSYYVDVKAEINKRPGWDTVKAVQKGHIITDIDTNLVNRAGPRSAMAVETVAKALYPDLF